MDITNNIDWSTLKNRHPEAQYWRGPFRRIQHLLGTIGAKGMIVIKNDAKALVFVQVIFGELDDLQV